MLLTFAFGAALVCMVSPLPWFLHLYLFFINVVAITAYFVDKRRAIDGEWRIPEARLHLLSVIGGAFGAYMGMKLARHKTRKLEFRLIICFGLFIMYGIAFTCGQTPDRPTTKGSPEHAASSRHHHRRASTAA